MQTMRKYLCNPIILIGFGTLVVTLVPFFAQGGFGKVTSHTYLYIIGLVIGVVMILYGLIKQVSQDRTIKQRKESREIYIASRDIPKLLWQVYERAKELVIADDKKSQIIDKIPDFDKTLADSGFAMPNNVSVLKMLKFLQYYQNPLVGKAIKLKRKEIEDSGDWVVKSLLSVQGAIDAEGLGALKLIYADQGVCKGLLSKIGELKIGLPDKIHVEVDYHILVSTAIANVSYFDLADKIPSQFKTLLPFFKPAYDNQLNTINLRITQMIETFLSGEKIK